ncbi:MAG: LTA synthase family protein, partial [Clostridium sp.]|nr:LTA synthase family protein [Clostridium sp.]
KNRWAKDYLTIISKKETPFNFTMLTVDTHHIDGYVCDLCEDEHELQYANVISCASRQLDEFINWIKMQAFYENTSIVIVGDHPTMDKEFVKDVDDTYLRTTYNVFINPAGNLNDVRLKNRDFYSFDFFPTTLSSLNVNIKGDRLGLGTNLFSDEPTLYEKYGIEMENEIRKKSKFYENTFLYPKE